MENFYGFVVESIPQFWNEKNNFNTHNVNNCQKLVFHVMLVFKTYKDVMENRIKEKKNICMFFLQLYMYVCIVLFVVNGKVGNWRCYDRNSYNFVDVKIKTGHNHDFHPKINLQGVQLYNNNNHNKLYRKLDI